MSKVECLICDKSYDKLSQHLSCTHHMTKEEYRDIYTDQYQGLINSFIRDRGGDVL